MTDTANCEPKLLAEVHDRARRIETKLSHLCERLDIDLRVKPIRIVIKNDTCSALIPGNDVTVSAIRKALHDNQLVPNKVGAVALFDSTEVPYRNIGSIEFQE
jgi:hypothetical protein